MLRKPFSIEEIDMKLFRRIKNHPDRIQIDRGRAALKGFNFFELDCAAQTALHCIKPRMIKRLKLHVGDKHSHGAQSPKEMKW